MSALAVWSRSRNVSYRPRKIITLSSGPARIVYLLRVCLQLFGEQLFSVRLLFRRLITQMSRKNSFRADPILFRSTLIEVAIKTAISWESCERRVREREPSYSRSVRILLVQIYIFFLSRLVNTQNLFKPTRADLCRYIYSASNRASAVSAAFFLITTSTKWHENN